MEKKWEFKKKIEDMTDEDVNEQQRIVMETIMPKLRILKYQGEDEWVTYETETGELLGVCPMTGLPDVYKLTLQYIPDKFIPELKSLKMYLVAFRNMPIFHENIASKIYNEFYHQVKPKKLRLDLKVNVRGGIRTNIRRGYE